MFEVATHTTCMIFAICSRPTVFLNGNHTGFRQRVKERNQRTDFLALSSASTT